MNQIVAIKIENQSEYD